MPSHDVFISYPSSDRQAADAVCHGLEARGVRCWMAPRDVVPGSGWQTALLDAIAEAPVMVLLFSAAANTSEHIGREVTAASESGTVVIPYRIENVSPQGVLRYQLTGVHWLDAFSGEAEANVDQLARTVKRVLERDATGETAAAAPPPLAARSAEPAPPAPPVATPPASGSGIKPWMALAAAGAVVVLGGVFVAGSMSGGEAGPAAGQTAAAASGQTAAVAPGMPPATAPSAALTPAPATPAFAPAPIPTPAPATTPAPMPAPTPTPASDPVADVMGRWQGVDAFSSMSMSLRPNDATMTIDGVDDGGSATYRARGDGSVVITDDEGVSATARLTSRDRLTLSVQGQTITFRRVG